MELTYLATYLANDTLTFAIRSCIKIKQYMFDGEAPSKASYYQEICFEN